MKLYHYPADLQKFLYFIATQKKELDQWSYIHVVCTDEIKTPLPVPEIVQFTTFYCKPKESAALDLQTYNELLIVVKKEGGLIVNKFEKDFKENFSGQNIDLQIRSFDMSGIDLFIRIVNKGEMQKNPSIQTQIARIRRPGNCIMILDDDLMVTKQLDKLLTNISHVIALNKPDSFFEKYAEFGPDILFLDIHLREAMGNELLRELKSKVDPYAHVVMISSDTGERIVRDIKEGGAKGFVVKPFNRTSIFQHLLRAPTFVPRTIRVGS